MLLLDQPRSSNCCKASTRTQLERIVAVLATGVFVEPSVAAKNVVVGISIDDDGGLTQNIITTVNIE